MDSDFHRLHNCSYEFIRVDSDCSFAEWIRDPQLSHSTLFNSTIVPLISIVMLVILLGDFHGK